ncbi:MAG: cyclic nucleotide-binding domain-containing protein, partial [Candidatus Poribacteria bacterium]|nr:cyclic nucleotide-binding domain-containing protein [Candidatus Poribacteria bacterium]
MRGSFSLDTTDLFAGVRPQTLQAAYALLQEKRYRRREMIFFPTALSNHLYLIGQGNVRLYKLSPEGKKITADNVIIA